MKTYDIDIQRLKAMSHDKGLIELRIDAQVQAQPQRDEGASSSRVQMSVDNARALLLLLKKQLADLDKTKARSQR
jgi:hypothetical protein